MLIYMHGNLHIYPHLLIQQFKQSEHQSLNRLPPNQNYTNHHTTLPTMPLFEIQHVVPLTDAQKDALAEAITKIHSTIFTTPRVAVNVRYTDVSKVLMYIAGKRRQGNHIVGNVRVGPARPQKDFDNECLEILAAWNSIVATPEEKKIAPDLDLRMRSCFLLGGMVAGYEAGFLIPPAGGDVEWLHDHFASFEEQAAAGDQDMADLVAEVKERGMLDSKSVF
jgi:phenylpyruvate tautomerase PptA (4-oxalocrotonate tautomerase family)